MTHSRSYVFIHFFCRRPWFDSWVRKIHWRRDRLPTPVLLGFPVAQLVKNISALQETWVQFLGWIDPLEKGKAAHSRILAWRIPWTVYSLEGSRESDMTKCLSLPCTVGKNPLEEME